MTYTIEQLNELFPGSSWAKTNYYHELSKDIFYLEGKDFEIQWTAHEQFLFFDSCDIFTLVKENLSLEDAQKLYKQYTKLKNFK